jgi:carboxylate-amine ligase
VCATVGDVARDLRRLRAHAVAAAAAHGLLLGCAGTHPFSLFEAQHVTGRARYRALVDQLQYVARRELIFGFHVHVAVGDPDQAIRLMGALAPHLCELVALSASSPLWRGRPTGFASSRHLIFSSFPRSGPPPHFESYAEYAEVVQRLVACGCIEDYTRTWWDVRPQPRFGTIEVRVMDAMSNVDDAVALTAYVQALVRRHLMEEDRAHHAKACHPVLTHENKWQAARHGLAATVVEPIGGEPVPVTALIERTLRSLAPHAHELGSDAALDGVRRILRDGNGAQRQLAVHAATQDALAVTRDIVELTRP